MSTLYLFTGQFPYSTYIECFLEDEIIYLAERFDKIIIVPTRGASLKRKVPHNCVVTSPLFLSKPLFLLKGLYSKRAFKKIWSDFISNKVYKSKKKLCVWIKAYLVINNLLNSNEIKEIEQSLTESDVCYYYWGKWSNLLALFLRGKCHHVSRFHGAWDLWEEEFDDYCPLRKSLVSQLDKSVFISKSGESYFKSKYKEAVTSFNPLGSIDYGAKPIKNDDVIRIVSCSTVYPLKRVDLIFRSVCQYAKDHTSEKIEWTHMGGGTSFENLRLLVNNESLENLNVKLLGNLTHSQVINYYQNNSYDVFINLSTNEGVPVSIMEALSFDIPIVATAVGGTPEIVTVDSGQLVPHNPTVREVALGITNVLYSNSRPREYWHSHYSAERNYYEFALLLKSISATK